MNSELLFVYGTLRRGFAHHNILRRLGARYLGRGSVRGELFDLGDFQGARKPNIVGVGAGGSSRVVGEIYRLPDAERAFRVLDEFEGHCPQTPRTGVFRRETVEVALKNGERVGACIYWLNRAPSSMRRIGSGDYASRRRAQRES